MTKISQDSPPTPEASFLRLSLFPATVQLPDSSTTIQNSNIKVMVTDSYLLVFTDSPTGPTLTHQFELIDFSGSPRIGYLASTPEGDVKINRSRGCGCGSRLRGFNPYRGIPTRGADYV